MTVETANLFAAIWREKMNEPSSSRLKRVWNEMPDDARDALLARGLMDAYRARPPYQQNDYMGWIGRA